MKNTSDPWIFHFSKVIQLFIHHPTRKIQLIRSTATLCHRSNRHTLLLISYFLSTHLSQMLMNQVSQQPHCQLEATPVKGEENKMWTLKFGKADRYGAEIHLLPLRRWFFLLLIAAFRKLWYHVINKSLKFNKTTAGFLCYFLRDMQIKTVCWLA